MFQQTQSIDNISFFKKISSLDYTLIICILTIGIISCFAMYSTDGGELLYHSKSHIIRFVVFFIMMIVMPKSHLAITGKFNSSHDPIASEAEAFSMVPTFFLHRSKTTKSSLSF